MSILIFACHSSLIRRFPRRFEIDIRECNPYYISKNWNSEEARVRPLRTRSTSETGDFCRVVEKRDNRENVPMWCARGCRSKPTASKNVDQGRSGLSIAVGVNEVAICGEPYFQTSNLWWKRYSRWIVPRRPPGNVRASVIVTPRYYIANTRRYNEPRKLIFNTNPALPDPFCETFIWILLSEIIDT